MRNYQLLDKSVVEDDALKLSNDFDDPNNAILSLKREGAFVSTSTSVGHIEIAIRMRYQDLTRHLRHLHPVPGLAVTRQVGSANSFLALGLTQDKKLVIRPTMVADASGHITFNMVTSPEVYKEILNWLEIEQD